MTKQDQIEELKKQIEEYRTYTRRLENELENQSMNVFKSETDVLNAIHKLLKEWYGDSVMVNIFVNSEGMECTTKTKPFSVGYSMRTINGRWLPRKE